MSYNVFLYRDILSDKQLLYTSEHKEYAEVYRHAYLDCLQATTPGSNRYGTSFLYDKNGIVIQKCVVEEIDIDPDFKKVLPCGCVISTNGIAVLCTEAKERGKKYQETGQEEDFIDYKAHFGDSWEWEKRAPHVIREV